MFLFIYIYISLFHIIVLTRSVQLMLVKDLGMVNGTVWATVDVADWLRRWTLNSRC